ncbi:MAG TPA: hypothetical protein PKE69_09125 [Pyrinomonadaceae bacterium]|nr:hypothetical protein [Pyrinomonadaceae bacterium]
MAKKSKKPLDILREKKDKLDWHKFNFLENLLVFCTMKKRNAPRESKSGVQFHINPKPEKECFCLMFHIDREKDPLIIGQGIKRPDYAVLFVENNTWICTIIEMKGATAKGFKHGIEQIKVLRNRLREELKVSASKVNIKYQAIMMIPFGSQIPRNLIIAEEKQGLVILPLQYDHKAELFSYISKMNKLSEKYIHEEIRYSKENSTIENILMNYVLQERITDNFSKSNKNKTTNGDGIYINYAFPDCEDYAALVIDNNGLKIAVKELENEFQKKIQTDLESIGLETPRHFEIETIES